MSDDVKKNKTINGEMIMNAIGDIDEDLLAGAYAFRNGIKEDNAASTEGDSTNIVSINKKKRSRVKYIALPIAAAALLALGVITTLRMGLLMPKESSSTANYSATDSATLESASATDSCAEAASEDASESYAEAASEAASDSDLEDAYYNGDYSDRDSSDGTLAIGDQADTTKDDSDSFGTEEESEAADNSLTGEFEFAQGETSIFALGTYNGYLDEAEGWILCDSFRDQDFDGDGINDRVYRSRMEGSDMETFTLELGNGSIVEIPETYYTGYPLIESGDMDDDGELEMVFSIMYDSKTDRGRTDKVWLIDRDGKDGNYTLTEIAL